MEKIGTFQTFPNFSKLFEKYDGNANAIIADDDARWTNGRYDATTIVIPSRNDALATISDISKVAPATNTSKSIEKEMKKMMDLHAKIDDNNM